jgi:ribose transport system permease protein
VYILTAIIFLIFLFIQKRTAFGKHVVGVGNSPSAMRHMGTDIGRVKLLSYGLSGLSTAIGSIVLCSRLFAGDPTVGTSYLLLIVAVVVVGGTSLTGGVGGIFNTLLGALTISVLQNVLQIMGVNIYYHPVVIGAVLIIAVAISLDKKRVLVVK